MNDINMTLLSRLSPEAQEAMIWNHTIENVMYAVFLIAFILVFVWFASKGV